MNDRSQNVWTIGGYIESLAQKFTEWKTMSATFTLLDEHILLLSRARIRWNNCETGAPSIDPKRPYGNSDVEGDVCEILGWTPAGDDGETECWSRFQRERAAEFHAGTVTALQIILVTKSFKPGGYVQKKQYDSMSWVAV